MMCIFRVSSLLTCLMLLACGSVPIGSRPQLARIDIQTTDLAALRVALRLPEAIRPRPGGVTMDVLVKEKGYMDEETSFLLAETRDPADLPDPAIAAAAPGTSLYAFRLLPEDVARFDMIRQFVDRKRAAGQHGLIGLSIKAKEFCLVQKLPVGPLRSAMYLKTIETINYIVVSQDLDLRQERDVAPSIATLEACGAAGGAAPSTTIF